MQTPRFQRAAKKLKRGQKAGLDNAIRCLIEESGIGDVKIGDLAGIRVYKFKMTGQLTLLSYRYDDGQLTLTLLMLGSHENFYCDLKR
ncbi:ParE-like toxin of type II ParDE toxin-antitoxin system [Modicisalibacter xianhensis]|uniref:ParE-like toxin of type II ParDE toxin-antitoxin system n=1 Tax=Modicisalibacter xianhensis TaxID=442341 RepID=A0A4R8FVW5_9GAMM|nr:type II toxin-antitoxin system RelE/ParE family toxin [Halomonas xianhensis]TDX30998.1 ParE-like toxin of type II ParDE toxin-antitoxin system [Halomonas xianhensis]